MPGMMGVLRTLSSNRAKAAKKMMLSGVAGRTRMMTVGDWGSSHRGYGDKIGGGEV